MTENVLISRPHLEAAQARRAGLHRTCCHLRGMLVSGDDAPRAARGALTAVVDDLADLWSQHVHTTEAPDGLLEQIISDSPRLANTVERFKRDHPAIATRIRAARESLQAHEADPATAEQQLLSLLTEIERHRRSGGDLIHHAYNVDIGLGE